MLICKATSPLYTTLAAFWDPSYATSLVNVSVADLYLWLAAPSWLLALRFWVARPQLRNSLLAELLLELATA
jgi:hypothetical protein